MKLPWLIFALLLVMCGAVACVLVTDEPTMNAEAEMPPIAAGHGIPHPTLETMQIGGDSQSRYAPIRIAVWVFAVAMIVFFAALLAFASRKGESKTNALRWPIGIGCAIHLLSVIGMLVSYEWFIADPDPQLVLAFPLPSAWMLYAVWPAPVLFVILYVLTFDRWTFRPEDERAFEQILQRRTLVSHPAEDAR